MSLIQASLEISLLYFQCTGTLYTSGECRGERQPPVPPPTYLRVWMTNPPYLKVWICHYFTIQLNHH